MARVGVFGGTFDPPHLGHMILAAEAADQLALDTVLWMAAPLPPHKADRATTPFQQRTRTTMSKVVERIVQVIESEVRPMIESHGGGIEFIGFDDIFNI